MQSHSREMISRFLQERKLNTRQVPHFSTAILFMFLPTTQVADCHHLDGANDNVSTRHNARRELR